LESATGRMVKGSGARMPPASRGEMAGSKPWEETASVEWPQPLALIQVPTGSARDPSDLVGPHDVAAAQPSPDAQHERLQQAMLGA